jgi:hypothetical protein
LFPLFATGVIGAGRKFTTGVVDTSRKFSPSVVDTEGNLPLVVDTCGKFTAGVTYQIYHCVNNTSVPVANLQLVSFMLVANLPPAPV